MTDVETAKPAEPIKLRPATYIKVKDLEPGAKGDNLIVKVVSSNVVVDKTRTDGSRVTVAEVKIGDDTGTVTLTARSKQVELMKPGNTIIIRNCKVDMFKGFMRLVVDKWGKIEQAKEPATFEVKIGDDTGTVTLTARSKQVELMKPGNTIIIRNCKVDMFKGFMRLVVDKWGKIEQAKEPATFEVNTKVDLSLTEYELVTVEE
eukprot:TRINITY_DN6996_c0_g1_i1.p1 TRINITY_DN6996_c0_g1~~TRINITY_DN6996_c0_g1_i1.p1  ORF type:complete len:204 (-),score=31.95 TRINITY_DN6996_c0_g1_i1:39-650(-)